MSGALDQHEQPHMVRGKVVRMPRPLDPGQVTAAHLRSEARIGRRFARYCHGLARAELCVALLRTLLMLAIGTSHDYALMPLFIVLAFSLLFGAARAAKLWAAAAEGADGRRVLAAHTSLHFRRAMPPMRQFAFLSEVRALSQWQALSAAGIVGPPVLVALFALLYFCFSFAEYALVGSALALELAAATLLYRSVKAFYCGAIVGSVDSVLGESNRAAQFAVARSIALVNTELHKAVQTIGRESSTEPLTAAEAADAVADAAPTADASAGAGFSGSGFSGAGAVESRIFMRPDYKREEQRRRKSQEEERKRAEQAERERGARIKQHARRAKQV